MNPEDVLEIVLTKLEECNIPYMITGSFASNVHGVPRATQDADVVIETDRARMKQLIFKLGGEFYADVDAAEEALEKEGLFNVVHSATGFKVDLIIRKARLFSQTEFSRRQQTNLLGANRWVASAEDVILAKLEWAKAGQSERQYQDAVNIARVRGRELDKNYLEKWAQDLEIGDLLGKLFSDLAR